MDIRRDDYTGDRSAMAFDKQTGFRTANPSVPIIANHSPFFPGNRHGINRAAGEDQSGEIIAMLAHCGQDRTVDPVIAEIQMKAMYGSFDPILTRNGVLGTIRWRGHIESH